MVFLINYFCDKYFRWFDSGDVQSDSHLQNINTVCLHTPEVSHWLPTREGEIVRSVRRRIGQFAPNLLIRLSAAKVDGPPPTWWPYTSTVFTEEPREGSYRCPSRDQGNR